jgi:hypothetical protein
MPLSETLNFPFFVLKYSDGVFERLIPSGAEDLGEGIFRQDGKTWKLPEEMAALSQKIIGGRPLLSVLKRGGGHLIKEGPRPAGEGQRLMELCAADNAGPSSSTPAFCITLRRYMESEEWLPLAELHQFKLCQNIVYEIIDDTTLTELINTYGGSGGAQNGGQGETLFTLRAEDIPKFAETHARLIFQFGDQKLKETLAEESVFADTNNLSLVLGAFSPS